jgi:HK97 family phage major capsid protein
MSDRLKRLREERLADTEALRAITNTAQTEKRDLSPEELAKHTEIWTAISAKGDQIEAEERSLEAQRIAAGRSPAAEERGREVPGNPNASPTSTPEYRAAFFALLTRGPGGMTPDEHRSLSAGIGSQGGFLLVPEQVIDDLIKFVDNQVLVRRLATVLTVPKNVASLGVPSLETDAADADWTSELAIGNETDLGFGKRKLTPSPLGKYIKVSKDLLRATAGSGKTNAETIVRDRLGYKFGVAQENAFLLGNGASQPLGLFFPSNDGIPTSRDLTAGTTTSLTFDGMIAARYALKDQYRARAKWLMNRSAIGQIAALKDTTGQYLWRPSVINGEPDMILGSEVISSEYVPAVFTTGLYVGMYGDFSNYWIADQMSLEIQRLDELFAMTNQTAFIGRMMVDGMPALAEAFVRLKLA